MADTLLKTVKAALARALKLLREFVHPLHADEKITVAHEVTQPAASSFDFLLLVVLSCSMATLGLIIGSPAVIIGAMLVAPLMSPIIGIGLASITGDLSLVRSSTTTLLRGAGLAILLSTGMTLINRNLPFVLLQELPQEVLARTHPSPIDLGIALAGGLAAAYALTRPNISAALPGVAIATALMPPLCVIGIGIALGRWDVAGGATLLFITNAVTIAFAAALVFFVRGFSPPGRSVDDRPARTLMIAAGITLALLVPLTYYSVQFFGEANANRRTNEVVQEQLGRLDAELVELQTRRSGAGLDLVLTLRTTSPFRYEQVVALQDGISGALNMPVSLKVNQIFAEQLDPKIPPTPTATPTPVPTQTPGPTATATATASLTPTPAPTWTPTPGLVRIAIVTAPPLQLYQSPDGATIGRVRTGQVLTLLYERREAGGLIWVQVEDGEGRIGWIPEVYIESVTATPAN